MITRLFIIAGILLLTLICDISYGQIYSYQNLSHREGLPLSSTSAVREKADGGILIGTLGAGIVEYDGYRFTDIIAPGQDNNHQVTGIEIIGSDIIFASKHKGVYKVNGKGEISPLFIKEKTGDYNDVTSFGNFLLITTSHGIYAYDYIANREIQINNIRRQDELHVFQTISSEKGCIFLTNHQHYIFTKNGKLLPLSQFFATDNKLLESMSFGYYKNGLLHLFDKKLEKGLLVELNENTFNYKEKAIIQKFKHSSLSISAATYNDKKQCFAFFSSDGNLYEEANFTVIRLPNNCQNTKITANKVICSYTGNYWITTHLTGIFRIGHDPFTKLKIHREFVNRQISYILKNPDNTIIFSNFYQSNTYTGNLYGGELKHHPIGIITGTYIENKLYVSSQSGVYEYNKETDKFIQVTIPAINPEKRIQFMSYQDPYIWIGIPGEGLYKFDRNFKLIRHYKDEPHVPRIVYTGQFSSDGKLLYLGTSNGITKLDISKEVFSPVNNHNLGHYCGSSVKDVFGTNWFALERGIIGISKRGELFTLSSQSLFPSYLFYTLNTDKYGNLIIGTNKGLNVIQVNEKGKVLNQRGFSAASGFDGYETHMGSSFQENNQVFVGTVEGMYLLDFDLLLQMLPPKQPVLEMIKTAKNSERIISFKFLSKNPRIKNILYTYRILNYQEKWSTPDENNEIHISDLKSGKYTLEVKATHDGATYSTVSTYTFEIKQPFLRDNLLIAVIILIVTLLIIYLYNESKEDATSQLFYSDESSLTQKYAPTLILFALIAHLISNEIAHFVSHDFKSNHLLVILTSCFLFIAFLIARYNKKKGQFQRVAKNLTVSFYVLVLFYIYSLYESSLHPFYGFGVVITSYAVPFIVEKTKYVIIFAVCFIGLNTIIIFSSTGINYDKFLLIIPIIISGLLTIFMSLVRHESVHQLAFISSIINKSSVIAIAMNKDGKLKYVSKNILNYIDVDIVKLMDESISFMNDFIPKGVTSRDIDLTTEFRDGKYFISPIVNTKKETFWFEWTCKEFLEDMRVLIGQDITEKINLQSTYEILVENAEDLIYKTDLDGNLQFLNNRFYDYLPYDKDILIGKNITEIVPKDYKESVLEHYKKQVQKGEKVTYFEFPILDKENQLQWFGQYVTLLFDTADHSEATGFLSVGRNITDRIKKDKIIEAQSTDIKSSIHYAKRIQLNLLPPNEKIESYFSESFILYKPKDIVSGDFYWFNQFGNYTILAVGDGTGHGVPGAFMSILGINLLNSIILEKQIHDPGRILDELDHRLKQMLSERKQGQSVNDGIEIAICVFNEETETLEYACAGAKLIIHDGSSFSVRKGDNKHIGDYHKDFQRYITHHSNIENDTTIYLFTDGFHNQFGGVLNKKFSIKRLLELFIQNISLPLKTQKEMFETELEAWKSTTEQTDDITIIGVRTTKKR